MAIGEILSSGILPETEEITFLLVNAVSFERKKVRVYFSDAPKAIYEKGADDALNPANWQVLPVVGSIPEGGNLSYTTLEVSKARIVPNEPLAVDVFVDDDFSFDLLYEVIVSASVVSASNIGGWSIAGNRSAQFTPYDPACRQKPVARVFPWFGKAAKKYDVQGDTEKFVSLLQDLLEQVKVLIDCFPEQFDPLYCQEDFLDSRMRSLGNPFEFITSEMTVVEKRRVALQLIAIYRLKGTTPGIKFALQNILGVQGVEVLSWNENTWRIGETFVQLGIPFDGVLPNGTVNEPFLGGGLFVPSGGSPGYPTTPIDPNDPENYQYTGTMFLGGSPIYNQAYLGSGLAFDDTKRVAVIGKWNLEDGPNAPYIGLPPNPPYALNPALQYVANPTAENDGDIGVTVENDRRGLHAYRIALPSGFAPSILELRRITAICKYMQPANMHLIGIGADNVEYDPVYLGISLLGYDWVLHG